MQKGSHIDESPFVYSDTGKGHNRTAVLVTGIIEYFTVTGLSAKSLPPVYVPELNLAAILMPVAVAALMIFAFLLNESRLDEPEEIVTAFSRQGS